MSSLKHRLLGLFDDDLLVVSAGLDQRFKLSFLAEVQQIKVKAEIVTAVSLSQSKDADTANSMQVESEHQPSKKARNATDDFWTSWDSMQVCNNQPENTTSILIDNQLNQFLHEPCILRDIDPVSWWQTNACRFPLLRSCTQRYLAVPPTRVLSQRLFSTAGNTLSDNRSCLLADNVKRLVFLKANVSFMQQ